MTNETPPTSDPTPWLAWPVGARVVVRRRTGEPDAPYADVLGTLLSSTSAGVEVRRDAPRQRLGAAPWTEGETIAIPAAEIALGKIVPPRPPRRIPRDPTPL